MNTVCAECLATNRLPDDKISDTAKCGRCKEPLFSGEVINATAATFDKLLQDELPLVIDFWAPWCGPCVGFAPVFEDVAEERAQQMRFIKVNTESEPELAARFRIRSIPTLMLYRGGQHLDTLAGALPKSAFEQWLDQHR